MFVIKYHAKGHQTQYLGRKRDEKTLVSNKKYAYAFGENLRNEFKRVESKHCSLAPLEVSSVAEFMYQNTHVLIKDIEW